EPLHDSRCFVKTAQFFQLGLLTKLRLPSWALAAPSNSDLQGKDYYEDGLVKLIIKAFADEVLREVSDGLSKSQISLLKEKLEKLPDHIQNHPAMGQKQLWEICQTTTQWEQLNRTQDYDGHEVEIVQDEVQQYVFSYRCATAQNPCTAISALYDSECTERKGWMYLYYRPLEGEDRTAKWGYVSVNHHCVCKVTPKGVR
ncbi:unnamed protein product, partial [Ixodes persulcatus]